MSAFNFLNHPLPQFGISGNGDQDVNLNFSAPERQLLRANLPWRHGAV